MTSPWMRCFMSMEFMKIYSFFGLDVFINNPYGGDVDNLHIVKVMNRDLHINIKV